MQDYAFSLWVGITCEGNPNPTLKPYMGIARKMIWQKKTYMEEEVEKNPSHILEDACENWCVHRHGKVYVMPSSS
jgi:hypothetical protein